MTHAGELAVLNVGTGDTKLSFDPKNPAERIRAARIVKDMIRRGYALMVETTPGSGTYVRALDFREDVCEYVIADFDSLAAAEADERQEQIDGHQQDEASAGPAPATGPEAPRRGRGRPRKGVDAATVRSVAVAPIAGG